MKKKILFVSYGHKNLKLASSIQNHRLVTALKDYYDVEVVCRGTAASNSVITVQTLNLYIIDRILYKLFPFLGSVFSIDRLLWSIKAWGQIKKIVCRYDYLVIPYEPYTTRKIQFKCRKYSNVKIVTILYDPYYDNIFFSQSSISKWLRRKIESKIIAKTDCVFVNNQRMLETFLTRYSRSNVKMIPLCGLEKEPEVCIPCNDKFTIVFAGNIFGERKIDSLNRTVSILKRQVGNLSTRLEIDIYGNVFVGKDKVKISCNDDVIIYKGFVTTEQINNILTNADALFLLDPINKDNYSFPSKLCEYFQHRKVIVAFSGEGTPSFQSLKESKNIVHTEGEEEQMADDIKQLLDNGVQYQTSDQYVAQFNPHVIAKNYFDALESL